MPSSSPSFRFLTFIFLVGFASLVGQFVYNRLIFFYVANSEYAAASIISLHLLGLLLGGIAAARLNMSLHILTLCALATSVFSYGIGWKIGVEGIGLIGTLIVIVIFSALNAFFSGWILVHLVKYYERLKTDPSSIIVSDSAGSVLGALMAGFIFVPRYGVEATFLILLVLQALALLSLREKPPVKAMAAFAVFTVVICGTAFGYLYTHKDDANRLLRARGFPLAAMKASETELLFTAQSQYGVINVTKPAKPDGGPEQILSIDSRVLCGSPPTGLMKEDPNYLPSEWAMGEVAAQWVQNPHAHIGIIGLGCGVTLATVLNRTSRNNSVETIEINREMPQATRLFEPMLKISIDDPRHTLTIEDGFRFFQERNKPGEPYDAVLMDIAWMQNMNSTHLYSKEMFEHVKRNLTPDGFFAVWSEEMNPFSEVSKIMFKTLKSVFPVVKAQQEPDGCIVFYVTADPAGEGRLDLLLRPESTLLNKWLNAATEDTPINELDNLVMNQRKFTWFGDSTFDRLFEKYNYR
jgi:predicted membrane-bound spermidine synthase